MAQFQNSANLSFKRIMVLFIKRLKPCVLFLGPLLVILVMVYIFHGGKENHEPRNHHVEEENINNKHDLVHNLEDIKPIHSATDLQKKDHDEEKNHLENFKEMKVVPLPEQSKALLPSHVNCDAKRSFDTPFLCLKDDTRTYFQEISKLTTCYIEGSNITITESHPEICSCLPGWHGQYCSVPDIVFHSEYPYEYGLRIKTPPRRIIYAMPFCHEFEMLEAKLYELYDYVDVFIILESNFTAAGKPRKRILLERLKSGFLKEYSSKILYLPHSEFPKKGYTDGWEADAVLRNHIGRYGLQMLYNIKEDDIFVINDADELPVKEAFLFLKLHYGYPEPFGFNLYHTVFGFFWEGEDRNSNPYGGCTIRMLREVYRNEPYRIRNALNTRFANDVNLGKYEIDTGRKSRQWSFGSSQAPAGWHCSWCFRIEGIQVKLSSAHLADTPRWGSIPGKNKSSYLRKLILEGLWFDDETKFKKAKNSSPFFAPKYALENKLQFGHLLSNDYLNMTYLK